MWQEWFSPGFAEIITFRASVSSFFHLTITNNLEKHPFGVHVVML